MNIKHIEAIYDLSKSFNRWTVKQQDFIKSQVENILQQHHTIVELEANLKYDVNALFLKIREFKEEERELGLPFDNYDYDDLIKRSDEVPTEELSKIHSKMGKE